MAFIEINVTENEINKEFKERVFSHFKTVTEKLNQTERSILELSAKVDGKNSAEIEAVIHKIDSITRQVKKLV